MTTPVAVGVAVGVAVAVVAVALYVQSMNQRLRGLQALVSSKQGTTIAIPEYGRTEAVAAAGADARHTASIAVQQLQRSTFAPTAARGFDGV